MIDRMLGPGLQQGESYYFQLIPIGLTLVNKDSELPSRDTTYRFTIYKGSQKFDENRIPINAEFTQTPSGYNALAITSCRLNFYIPSLVKGRKVQFTLRLIQHEGKQDYELGDFGIDVSDLVEQFKKDNISRHEVKAPFSEDYELEFEIYIDTNRVALEKNIRDKKTDRAIKSPLRQRKEGREEESASGRKNLTSGEEKHEKDVEPEAKAEVEEVKEEKVEHEALAESEPKVSESRKSKPAPAPSKERSEKAGSIQSKQGVPIVQTKFKPVAKLDCPSEIQMTESQRLANTSVETALHSGHQNPQEKFYLIIFLIFGALMTYWAMNPTRKV